MLEAAERVDRGGHGRRRRAGDRAHGGCRHDVIHQMRAEQMDRLERDEPFGRIARPIDDPSVFDDRAVVDRAGAGERPHRGATAPRDRQDRRIVGVDDGEVARVLVLEDPRLRRGVRVDVRMSIEMIR